MRLILPIFFFIVFIVFAITFISYNFNKASKTQGHWSLQKHGPTYLEGENVKPSMATKKTVQTIKTKLSAQERTDNLNEGK